jgi:L-2-hydroxyglutarate oxidase LhgO
MDYDALVIGAGVVGLACAERLSRDGRSVLVVERHASFGRETSSRNSQVVHAGLYYAPGSLKARLCVAGNRSLYAWCEEHGVAFARTGKHVVATSAEEEPALEALLARGEANGVALRRVSAAELAVSEPAVIARAALCSPSSGIVDSHGLMSSLLAAARCDVAWQHEIVRAERDTGGYALTARDASGAETSVRARTVVNAAGLWSDELSTAIGIDVDAAGYRQRWVKGSYFRLRGARRVRSLVYPIPPPGLAGLGIHLTLELDGTMRLGPDVDERACDRFFAAASRYLRDITPSDLTPDQAGIRPKLTSHDGAPRDFVITEESARGLPGWITLAGIESPGLTCALEIADLVATLAA